MTFSPCVRKLVVSVIAIVLSWLAYDYLSKQSTLPFTTFVSHQSHTAMAQAVDLSWHPPAQTQINNLTHVVGDTGVYGFIYNTSHTPDAQYGVYNWCNMPHVRRDIYIRPSSEYQLVYVELIHRHHKRTPYASNSFPVESYPWFCSDEGLFYFGRSFGPDAHQPAETYWKGYASDINPFHAPGWTGDCQFPQITSEGLQDSWTHGADLYDVYHDLLGFLPARGDEAGWRDAVVYRVTTNQITSQVAAMVASGMSGETTTVPLLVQQVGVDSLEPAYSCPASATLYGRIKSRDNPAWKEQLDAAQALYQKLDDISGVDPADDAWHLWFDHYYDNLSARQCHSKPLPCKIVDGKNSTDCVDQKMADEVYRFGQWEYSRLYRGEKDSLAASAGSMGVWIAEVAENLRAVKDGKQGQVRWRHNVAHDGSVSRVLSVLQVDEMVWPGMGSEVVFEVWKRRGCKSKTRRDNAKVSESGFYVRVLFSGRVLKSSNPSLGAIDMLPVETLLAYFDGLVGARAGLVKGLCNA